MRAMILAAGRGERMRPLTDQLPKPLLTVNGKPLMQYHIEALAAAGITELVINHAIMGEMIEQRFGDGGSLKVNISYSAEGDNPLETGGGIYRALPLLGDGPFIVINGDIWTDFDISKLPRETVGLAHLVMVNNPAHHSEGDFCLNDGEVGMLGKQRYTFSGIGVYRAALFKDVVETSFPLAPLLRRAMQHSQVSGELHEGEWCDVGTAERLQTLNN